MTEYDVVKDFLTDSKVRFEEIDFGEVITIRLRDFDLNFSTEGDFIGIEFFTV